MGNWVSAIKENKNIIIEDFKEYLREHHRNFYNDLDNFLMCENFRSYNIENFAIRYVFDYVLSFKEDIQKEIKTEEQENVKKEMIKILCKFLKV